MSKTVSEFKLQMRVYFEDTDAAGIVYHANYLKFMERARTEWLRFLGYDQRDLNREHKVGFVVRKMGLDFIRPAYLDDQIQVVSSVKRCGKASIVFVQSVERNGEQVDEHAGSRVLCRAEVKVGCIDIQTGSPQAMAEKLYREIKNAS